MPDGLSMNLRKELFSLSTKTSNRVRAQFNGDYVFRFVQIVLHEFHQKSSFVTFLHNKKTVDFDFFKISTRQINWFFFTIFWSIKSTLWSIFYRSNPQAQKHFAILRAGTFLTCVAPKRPSFNSLNTLYTVFLSRAGGRKHSRDQIKFKIIFCLLFKLEIKIPNIKVFE